MAVDQDIKSQADSLRAQIQQNGRSMSESEWKGQIDKFKDFLPKIKSLSEDDQQDTANYVANRVESLGGTGPNGNLDANDQYVQDVGNYITQHGCFTKGTYISTPQGEVLIEELKEGDLVNTLSGPKPLKWVGYRTLTDMAKWNEREKTNNYPVHILANALEDGVPARNISVSAWHHIHVGNVLIRAMDLINGTTIYQDKVTDSIQYYHLELEEFDMILAHGMYSESYTDNGKNRGFYDNAVTAIRPQTTQKGGMSPRPGFSVVRPNKNGDILVALKAHLDARALQIAEEAISNLQVAAS